LHVSPLLVSKINPQLGALLNYPLNADVGFRIGLAAVWITPFMLVVGMTQLPITESSVSSTSFLGKIIPFFFCIVVISLSGSVVDSLINEHFRDAIRSLDNTIQFTLDNKNNPQVDEAIARRMNASSLNSVQEYVVQTRHLYVGKYENTFGEIQVLIIFKDQWVDCTVIYSQPAYCKIVD
jgi:hypothetical protein